MISINDVNQAIMHGTFTNDQLESIGAAIRFRRSQLAREVKREMRPGIAVKFYHPKLGTDVHGTVNRIKQKYILVDTNRGRYNVPANLLEVA